MDIFTHTFTGILLSRAFRKDREYKKLLILLVISSLLPDIDYLTRLWGVDVFLRYHRGITHGVLFLVIVPIGMAVLWRFYSGGRFMLWFYLSLLAYSIHLFLDIITQYPMRILSPFSWTAYSWDLVFIIDPYITGAVLLGIWLTFKTKKSAQQAHIVFIVICVLAIYVGVRALTKSYAEKFLEKQLHVKSYTLSPLLNDFLRWWFVAEDNREYKTGFIDLFSKSVCFQDLLDKDAFRDKLIIKTKELKIIKNFLYFAKTPYPVIYRSKNGIRVLWKELSYSFIPGEHFVAVVEFDNRGKIKKAYAKIR